MDWIFDID